MNENTPQCALCPYDASKRFCRSESGKAPANCPTVRHQDMARQTLDEVRSGLDCEFTRQASIQEGEGYDCKEKGYGLVRPIKPRILEVIEFSRKMGYKKVALVFCIGLRREAAVVNGIFANHGLEVISLVCKVGRIPKEAIGIAEEQKVVPGSFEPMCNPMFQARLANHYRSQFNVLLGLCVGHDSLFFKYAEAPCTVLAVKDRMLGHNPLAAVYQFDSYCSYLGKPSE